MTEALRPSNLKDRMASTFPFDQLAPEIQLMIAKESVFSTTSVAVGCPPGSLSRPGGYAGGILLTCSAFHREDLCQLFHEKNVFELMNSDWRNFFQHHGKNHIQRLILRTHNFVHWQMNMLWLIENLMSLENLKDVGIRVDGRWDDLWVAGDLPLEAKHLKKFLQIMCRVCKNLNVIQILIDHENSENMIPEWILFLESSLNRNAVWPAGMPDGRKPITFTVRECILLTP
ncbi:hypothetical protein MMC32_004626 [Xylographa parallela]|nr:hypothetical protein [Xylographa parallela]